MQACGEDEVRKGAEDTGIVKGVLCVTKASELLEAAGAMKFSRVKARSYCIVGGSFWPPQGRPTGKPGRRNAEVSGNWRAGSCRGGSSIPGPDLSVCPEGGTQLRLADRVPCRLLVPLPLGGVSGLGVMRLVPVVTPQDIQVVGPTVGVQRQSPD